MAVKTKAQLLAEVASLLADNTTGNISALDVRTCLNDIIDSASYGGTKVYKALLTQTGTSAPVATVLVNTLSGTPVWSYSATGRYVLTLTSEFTSAKTSFFINATNSADGGYLFGGFRANTDEVNVSSSSAGVLSNDLLNETTILIEVYP